MQVYFMVETIKTAEISKPYLYKISNSLLEPMTVKAYKEQENPTRYVLLLFFNFVNTPLTVTWSGSSTITQYLETVAMSKYLAWFLRTCI